MQDEETSATKSTKEIRRVVEAIENDALTTDEAVDRLAEIANQDESRDLPPIDENDIPEEREEAPPEDELAALTAERKAQEKHYYDAEVNVTAGEISVKFEHYPGETVKNKIKKAGLRWDPKTRTWWGTPTRKALETVQELTGQKLIEDEFKPQTKRITKEEGFSDRERRSETFGAISKRYAGIYDERGMGEVQEAEDGKRDRRNEAKKGRIYTLYLEGNRRAEQIKQLDLPIANGKEYSEDLTIPCMGQRRLSALNPLSRC